MRLTTIVPVALAAALLVPGARAEAQWRAEATVAARAARAVDAGSPSAPASTAPAARAATLAGTSLDAAAAWRTAARGAWSAELAADAGHDGLGTRAGGDARAVVRLAWSRGARLGVLVEGGGILAWRLQPGDASVDAPGAEGLDSSLALTAAPRTSSRSIPSSMRGIAGAVGGWTRLGGVLLTATARTSSAGMARQPWEEMRERIVPDSSEIVSHFDSSSNSWVWDTLPPRPVSAPYLASGVHLHRLLQTDFVVGATTGIGALALSMTSGVRHVSLGGGGEGWATARATLALRDGLGLSLQASRLAADAVRALPARRELQLGVVLRPWGARGLPVALPAAAAPTARRFAVRAEADGRMTLVVEAPGAQSVELMGDFTSWRIVPLVRDGAGRWHATLALPRGVHQLNVRIDGGAWLPPPGLGTGDDGFGGTVGVLVL